MLGILMLGLMPTLGFFSPGSALVLLVLFLFIAISYFKGIKIIISKETIAPASLLMLICAAYYYGGFYQPAYLKAMGQAVFFIMIILILWRTYAKKQPVSPWFLILFYIILGAWTLITSPHPQVDTVVVFKEAPLKLLHGINPYSAMFSRVYPAVTPDYYSHLPITFLMYLPFAIMPVDERIAAIFMTIISFFLLYKSIPSKYKKDSLLPLSLILFMPGSFYMLEHLYSETMVFFFFSLFVYFTFRSERWKILFLSFFVTVKQNILLTLPFFISRKLFEKKHWLLFLVPFLPILFFFLWNPHDFWNDTVLGLTPGHTSSSLELALTFPNLLLYFLPASVSPLLLRTSSAVLFLVIYMYILIAPGKDSPFTKAAIALFSSYFFSYYAYFNCYYLVLLLLLFSFVYEAYLTPQYKRAR